MSKNLYSLTGLDLVDVIMDLFIQEQATPIISKEALFTRLYSTLIIEAKDTRPNMQEYLIQIEEEIDLFISDN